MMGTRWRDGGRALQAYVWFVVVLGTLSLVASSVHPGFGFGSAAGHWVELAVLVAVLCVCEVRPISVVRAGGTDSIVASTTFAFAMLLMFGPSVAMVAQGLASVLADVKARQSALKVAFNVAQYWTALLAAGVAFAAARPGEPFGHAPSGTSWTLAVVVSAVTYFAANNVLVSGAMSLDTGERFRGMVAASLRSEWRCDVVLLALTPIVVIIVNENVASAPLLLLPIFAVYRSTTVSAEKQHLALHDSLTDLPNRLNFASQLASSVDQSIRRSTSGAVLLIDLDRFKEVNDTLGHQAGDNLLREIGPRITEALPAGSTVARLGGDEFAVLLPELDASTDAVTIGRRVGLAIETPFIVEGFNIEVGASIGVAVYPSDGTGGDTLMKRADIAMYVAKERRTIVERYDVQLDHHSTRRLELVGELRRAIGAGEVELHFQPKLDLATGEVREVEALVRWFHPRLGLVPPSEFVPLAEHTGLIRPLTSHVLRSAVSDAAKRSASGRPITVAVNLSARSLHDGAILHEVLSVLREHHVAPGLLRLEITESSIMADPERARRVLSEIAEMGIRLSIDDFGTGYSSLAYLKDLPVTEIKIDRSFVTNLVQQEDDQVIVRSILDLSRNLRRTSVAEGVETPEVLEWLRRAGCDQAQGYHIARPMSGPALTEWLAARELHADDRPAGATRDRRSGVRHLVAVSDRHTHDEAASC